MITEIITKWEKNKHKLEEYFRTTKQSEYTSYETIFEKIFELVINEGYDELEFDTSKITKIDDGDYQGTDIFIIPKKTYQPSVDEYIISYSYYGSCSGCDTLQAIASYDDDEKLPDDQQVSDYMTLALHMVQRMRWLYNKNEDE